MDTETELARAVALHRQGDVGAATPVYRAILERQPDHPEALHLLGVASLQEGDAARAAELIGRAVAIEPDKTRMHNNLGAARLALGEFQQAADCFRRSEQLDGEFAEAPYNFGNACRSLKNYEESEAAYRRAIALAPDHAQAHNNLGALLMGLGRFGEALPEYRAAYRYDPDSADILGNLVLLLEHTNELEEAESLSKKLLEAAPDKPTAMYTKARLERRDGNLDAAREIVDAVLADKPGPLLQVTVLFELARILDAQGKYRQAFEACERAKSIRLGLPDAQTWDITRYRRRVSDIRAAVTAELIASAPIAAQGPADPIFFVGFPRSGTTLMEQILGSHSALVTTGEQTPMAGMTRKAEKVLGRRVDAPLGVAGLSDEEILVMRELFFDIAREVTGDDLSQRRLVDKMPMNIVVLGAVNRIFPDARIIVALRDPRDACLSSYMQFFQNNNAMLSFMTLKTTGEAYAAVMDLWLHYRNILTVPWHEYRYEDLVDDFDGTVRKILEFLDVEWEDSVTRFAETARTRNISTPSYAMVTEGITGKAVGRWRNYQKQLAPILPIIEPFVKEFGYEPS